MRFNRLGSTRYRPPSTCADRMAESPKKRPIGSPIRLLLICSTLLQLISASESEYPLIMKMLFIIERWKWSASSFKWCPMGIAHPVTYQNDLSEWRTSLVEPEWLTRYHMDDSRVIFAAYLSSNVWQSVMLPNWGTKFWILFVKSELVSSMKSFELNEWFSPLQVSIEVSTRLEVL